MKTKKLKYDWEVDCWNNLLVFRAMTYSEVSAELEGLVDMSKVRIVKREPRLEATVKPLRALNKEQ
tara:strand:+ start:929 stop:1126 length:198 start_codon:yes stop_codon:yes gene_type:complete